MPRITSVEVVDVRFPTSLTLDGSDAMNKDGDYSAAYVLLHTDDSGPVRIRLHLHHRTGQRPVRRGGRATRPAAGRS